MSIVFFLWWEEGMGVLVGQKFLFLWWKEGLGVLVEGGGALPACKPCSSPQIKQHTLVRGCACVRPLPPCLRVWTENPTEVLLIAVLLVVVLSRCCMHTTHTQVYSNDSDNGTKYVQDVFKAQPGLGAADKAGVGVVLCGHKDMCNAVKEIVAAEGVDAEKVLLNF